MLTVYYVQTVGMNPLQLVLVGTTIELTVLLFEIPTGVVADLYSGGLPSSSASCDRPLLRDRGFPLRRHSLCSSSASARPSSAGARLGRSTSWVERAAEPMCATPRSGLAGGFAGILIGTALGAWRLNLPIWLGGALIIGLSLFLILVMPERSFTPAPRERESWRNMLETTREGTSCVYSPSC